VTDRPRAVVGGTAGDQQAGRCEVDAEEMRRSARNVDIPVVGDCKSVLQELIDALPAKTAERFTGWRKTSHDGEVAKRGDPAATTRPTATSTRSASWKR
jgi:thiamine pyrophosphate-dependent acetolactate synthase large subunit-like protein